MTTDTGTVADALDDARRSWSDWQDAWTSLQQAMRAASMSTTRIDAYRVGSGYDEGGGQSLEGWLDEIEDTLRACSRLPVRDVSALDPRERLPDASRRQPIRCQQAMR